MSDVEKLFFEPAEVARRFGISISTLDRMRKRGEIAAYKVSGRWKYTQKSIDDFLVSSEQCAKNSQNSESVSTGSGNFPTPPTGISHGLKRGGGRDANRLAQATFKKQN